MTQSELETSKFEPVGNHESRAWPMHRSATRAWQVPGMPAHASRRPGGEGPPVLLPSPPRLRLPAPLPLAGPPVALTSKRWLNKSPAGATPSRRVLSDRRTVQ